MSTRESRKVCAEYASLLVSLGFERSFPIYTQCLCDELALSDIPNLFFRGNALSARLAMELMRAVGAEYVKNLSAPVLACVSCWTELEGLSYEVSEVKLQMMDLGGRTVDEHLVTARVKFLTICSLLLDTICATAVPEVLRSMLWVAKERVDAKWQDVKPDVVNSMFVLRLVIPGLLSDETLPLHVRRVVIRAAQVIQSMSNEVKMNKEHDMRFVDAWMDEHVEKLREWKLSLLSKPALPLTSLQATSATTTTLKDSDSANNTTYPELINFLNANTEIWAQLSN